MKNAHFGAALALGLVALFLFAGSADAQHVVDPSVVMPGATMQAPLPAAGAEFASPVVGDGAVSVPWGDWLSEFVKGFAVLAGGLAMFVLRRAPANVVAALDMVAGMFMQKRANELLAAAITYGINTTSGALRGRTLTVRVGNEVIERAAEYALRHAPVLVDKLGGALSLREKIIARLDLEADAALPTPKPPAETLISAAAMATGS